MDEAADAAVEELGLVAVVVVVGDLTGTVEQEATGV